MSASWGLAASHCSATETARGTVCALPVTACRMVSTCIALEGEAARLKLHLECQGRVGTSSGRVLDALDL